MTLSLSRRRMLQMAAAFAPSALAADQPAAAQSTPAQPLDAEPDLRPTASRVHPGPAGRLVYTPDELGNTIPDFSYAGYGGGGIPIPTVPVRETVWPVAGDNTAALQAAIDRVSALPRDEAGFRGALLLRMGDYRLASPLNLRASGVVLRGEGMGDTGTVLIGTGNPRANAAPGPGPTPGPGRTPPTLIQVSGTAGAVPQEASKQPLLDDFIPVGTRELRLSSTRGFRPGDTVIVRRFGNQAWIEAMGMNGTTRNTHWDPFNVDWDRVVTEVQGNTLTIDAPITCAIEKRWGGGEILHSTDPGRIEKVGIENLRGVSEFDPSKRTREYGNMDRPNYLGDEYYADEDHFWNLITLDNVRDAWVRRVTALHFANSLAGTQRGAKGVTIEDCISREPVSRRLGGRRFTFALRGELTLVQRCHSDKGRHSFMMGQPTATLNVYLDCAATIPFSSSETHEQWATGGLYDNVHAPLTARFWKDFIIGWAGGNTVFWNCEGPFLIQKPPTAQNFSFGHIGTESVSYNTIFQDLTREPGYIESLDTHVTPRSLYLAQLRDRLGESALQTITQPIQRS